MYLIFLQTKYLQSIGEVYSIQHYVIKFVYDLWQVGGFLLVFRFPPPIKLTATVTEILWKVALNTITITSIHIPPPKRYIIILTVLNSSEYSVPSLYFP